MYKILINIISECDYVWMNGIGQIIITMFISVIGFWNIDMQNLSVSFKNLACQGNGWNVAKYFNDQDNSSDTMHRPFIKFGNVTLSTNATNQLSAPDCGHFKSSFIVGGREAPEGSHPWVAAIFVQNDKYCCCGAIINEWWIITAAHIFK